MSYSSRFVVHPQTKALSRPSQLMPASPWPAWWDPILDDLADALSERGREVSADTPARRLGLSRPRRRVERDDPDTGPDR